MSLSSFDPDTCRPLTSPLWPLHLTPSHKSPAPLIKFQIMTSDILREQEKGTQISMSQCHQSFTFTENVAEVPSSAPHLLHTDLSIRPVTTLYCILYKNSSLILQQD